MNEIEPKFQRGLLDYCAFLEAFNARSIRLIEKLVEPGIHFKNPLNDVMGVEQVQRVFKQLFEITDKVKIKIIDASWGDKERTAYIRWNLTYEREGRRHSIEGMSELMFSNAAKVMLHIDYWDAGENLYEHIPVLGRVLRFVKSKLKIE